MGFELMKELPLNINFHFLGFTHLFIIYSNYQFTSSLIYEFATLNFLIYP